MMIPKIPIFFAVFFNLQQLLTVHGFTLHSGNPDKRAFCNKVQHRHLSSVWVSPPLLLGKSKRSTQLELFKWAWWIFLRDSCKDDDKEDEIDISPIKYLEVPVIVGATYSSARWEVMVRQTRMNLEIPIYEGTHTWTSSSPSTNIGNLRFFSDPILLAAIRFTYTYDSNADMLTITGDDFEDSETSTTLITWPRGLNQFSYQPTFRGSCNPCNNNPNWDYTTSLTPGLASAFTNNIRDVNRLIYNQTVAEFSVVRVKTPFPSRELAEADEYHFEWIAMFSKDNEFLGTYDPEKEYPPGTTQRHLAKSTWGGEVTFYPNENFANVIGSTMDPPIAGYSWIELWRRQFGIANPTCTSLNWAGNAPGFICTQPTFAPNIVGGHVILGKNASAKPPGSNDVYIMPICKAHNNNDQVYMRAQTYTRGVWLNNYNQ